jgi:hypothetical protein
MWKDFPGRRLMQVATQNKIYRWLERISGQRAKFQSISPCTINQRFINPVNLKNENYNSYTAKRVISLNMK